MATDRSALPEADLDRIYSARIRPDLFDGAAGSAAPTAVFVGGQPGSGRAIAVAKIRAHLAQSIGPTVLVSGEDLREYHPRWQSQAASNVHAAAETRADIGRWFAKATADVVAAGANVLFESSMQQAQPALVLAAMLKEHKYELAAVIVASHRDESRQALMVSYDLMRDAAGAARFVPAADHDSAYDRLRETLGRLEAERAVDRMRVVTRDGRELYANRLDGDRWVREPKAVAVLDDFRERRLTARELADSALRWQTLVQRLAVNPTVPREVASQVVAWRNEATEKAEGDPQAQYLLVCGREAEAFRTMNRYQFLREFPQHAKAVERLDEAFRFAEKNFKSPLDRERFIAKTRERLVERIAEGRFGSPDRTQPEREPRSC